MQEVTIPCPLLVVDYFKAANAIDVHNHMRQGVLYIETSRRTYQWRYRMLLSVLGMIITDAWFAHKFHQPPERYMHRSSQ